MESSRSSLLATIMECSFKNLPVHLVLCFSLAIALPFAVGLPREGCPSKCGDVDIEYPFGIGPDCAMKGFELLCNKSEDGSRGLAFFSDYPVLNMSLSQGQVRMKVHTASMCGNRSSSSNHGAFADLDGTPFTISERDNMFTVMGANALALLIGSSQSTTLVIGCFSQPSPYNNITAEDGSCAGVGCCQVALTGSMSYHNISFGSDDNSTDAADTEQCKYAMVIEAARFRFRTAYLNTTAFWDEYHDEVPVILDWVVGDEVCNVAKTDAASYACRSSNSDCIDSISRRGYLCRCSEGYDGNPYLPDGCQDVDECAVNNPRPCSGQCVNTQGGFYCPNERSPLSGTTKLTLGASLGTVMLVILISGSYLIRERRKLSNIKEKHFRQHGGLLLLEKITSSGQGTGFTIFTEAELMEATSQFDDKNVLGRGGHGTVYKGTLKNGSAVAIKRCTSSVLATNDQRKREFGKEMLILSQVNHRNIVKLLGCCLEVEVPMLVYEFIPNGTLYHFIHGSGDNGCRNHITLSTRLRIAHESAQALDYLHSCASPPILHGDVKSSNILLADNYTAKVSDFGASIVAPTDEAQFVTLVQGTCGYLDPEYMQTCQLTDKSDVYSFGVVLLELITGKKALSLDGPESERSLSMSFLCAVKEGRLMDMIDDRIRSDGNVGLLEEVADLARRCLEMVGEQRPAMRDVVEKLGWLRKAMQHPWVLRQDDHEEMDSLLGKQSAVADVENLEMVDTAVFTMEKGVGQGLLEFGR